MIVGQGPIVLAVGAGGGFLDIFPSSIFSLFFLPLFGTEILSQRAVKPKTINQPLCRKGFLEFGQVYCLVIVVE